MAQPQAALYMQTDPDRAVELCEAALQGVQNKAVSDPVKRAEALSLDASVNFGYGLGRYHQVQNEIAKNFGLGRDLSSAVKFFQQFDAVKERVNQSLKEREDAKLHVAQALREYDQAIVLAINADRSDIAAQCSNDERKIFSELVRISGGAGRFRSETARALVSELKFSERAVPPYRISANNQKLIEQSLRELSEGDLVKEPMRGYLKTRANAVSWRLHIGDRP